jgi:hypothetical protein
MPTQTDPKTGLLVGVQDASSSNADLVEILQTFSIPDGSISGMIACEPPKLVGRPQPGKSFAVQYISVFARVASGQQAHCMVNTDIRRAVVCAIPSGNVSGL